MRKIKQNHFSKRVYAVVAKIPKGKTMTYKQVATKAGNPLAARAVGMLMSKNYNPKIPCHRVVRSDGKESGYNRGGWARKLKRLHEEGAVL
ncbi:MAG: MGMT family protein [Patescibacteria group bacterium]|nr:MGMT family protein [Patescibacteria group bacterium]